MSFPPIVVDNTVTPISERPVYVYGRSGRCWKFRNAECADTYFDSLIRKTIYPEFLTHFQYLIDTYGESIIERLQMCGESYYTRPIITQSDYTGEITHHGRCEHVGLARKYTYFYKKAKITITCNEEYKDYFGIDALLHLFPQEMRRHVMINMFTSKGEGKEINSKTKLRADYLLGDRIRYPEPQPRPKKKWCWNLFCTKPVYEIIDLHLE